METKREDHGKNYLLRDQLLTKEDLTEFRQTLLNDIKNLINASPVSQKKWLKGDEVRKLLRISPGTLQNLRVNGTLTYTRVGSIIYYDYAKIEAMLDSNKRESITEDTLFNRKQKGGNL